MKINDVYKKYKDRPADSIDPKTKNHILSYLSSLDSINSCDEARQFITILSLVRRAQVEMEGKKRNNTLRTLLSAGEEGAYVENNSYINERFMYELIQNVDDCKYSDPKDCKLKIDFDLINDKMVLAYNELGFRPEDVIAISDIGYSTKNHHKSLDQEESNLDKADLQEIGEKGIGFKSIFGLADRVVIDSGYFHFYFDYEDFTVPKIFENTFEKKVNGTVLTVYLKKGITVQLYKMLETKYKDNTALINENPVLFLNKLTEIIYSSNNGYFGFKASRQTDVKSIDCELMTIEYISSNKKDCKSIECYRFVKEVAYTLDECRSRFGNDEESERKYKIEIITPANMNKKFEGRIYSFFPTEQSLTVPMIIHAPFKLDSSRTNIANQSVTADSSNPWFMRTKSETIDFVYHVYKELARQIGFKIIDFIPDKNIVSNKRCPLYDSLLSKNAILNLDIFQSIDGKFYPANKLCFLDKTDITLEDAKEIYNILGIQIPMLNTKPKTTLKCYGFKKIDNIDNRLFQKSLIEPSCTSACLKYLEDYTPESFSSNRQYILELNQLKEFINYPHIIDFINKQLVLRLRNKESIRFCLANSQLPEKTEDLRKIREYCQSNEDHLQVDIYHFLNEVLFDEDELWEKSIYLTNCLFGTNVVETFNSLLNLVDNRYRNFFSFIRFEEIEKEIGKLMDDPDCTDNLFLKKIVDVRTAQRNVLGNQYKNIIKLINEAGTKPQRFLMELLQNIDDCDYEEEPLVEFNLEGNKLTVVYNETGFTKKHVASITAIGDSTKQYLSNENITGEKGIGFKSIFNVANYVEIHSNGFHFSLSSEEPTVPKKIKTQKVIKGTKMIIDVKNGYIDDYFTDDYLCDMCLCLKQVNHLKFNGKELLIQDYDNLRTVTYEHEHEYYKFVYDYYVQNEAIRKERYDNAIANAKQQITYLIPKKIQECRIYSTFPTSELMNVPVIVDANLKLNTSRDSVLQSNKWNLITIQKIHQGFLWMLEKLKTIDYEKIAEIIPYGGWLTTQFSYGYPLDEEIKNLPIFRVYNTKNEYIRLNDGFIAEELDKYIIKKWGYQGENGHREQYRSNCIDFDMDKISCEGFYEKVGFNDFCKDLADSKSYDVIHPKYLKDDEFRNLLYKYIESYGKLYGEHYISYFDFNEIGINDWEIIPVKRNKKTEYVKYSNKIYYAKSDQKNISNQVMILDQEKMGIQLFNFIYLKSTGYNHIIQEYSETIVLDEIVKRINECANYSPNKNARCILELYNSEKVLFTDCVKRRKADLNINFICLVTRDCKYRRIEECYTPFENERGSILDHVIVKDDYVELAKVLGVQCISQIEKVNNIYEFFDYDNLNHILDLKSLRNNQLFFDNLYNSMFQYGYKRAVENEVYLKLVNLISPEVVKSIQGKFKINKNCLKKYATTITKIFFEYPNHKLELDADIKLLEFENYDVLNDFRNDIQTRKIDERIKIASSLLDNCYYCENLGISIIPIRLEGDKNIILVDQNITSEYDLVSSFKAFFSSGFSLALSVTRDAERYSRDNYESISTIDYDKKEEDLMTFQAEKLDYADISKVKDFMCRPLVINNKVFGGYARTCPLCGSKVHTELTGMRLYKFKDDDYIYEFISCPNCYENLRYSSNLTIDKKDFENNYLTFSTYVNGEEWNISRVKIRLGHKSIINALNKKAKK